MQAFGAWGWRWSHEVWGAVTAAAIRLLRTMAGIARNAREAVAAMVHEVVLVVLELGPLERRIPMGHQHPMPGNEAVVRLGRT